MTIYYNIIVIRSQPDIIDRDCNSEINQKSSDKQLNQIDAKATRKMYRQIFLYIM